MGESSHGFMLPCEDELDAANERIVGRFCKKKSVY